jgi:hypothetical protein
MTNSVNQMSWWARIFRNRARLIYWLGDEKYQVEVADFKEVAPDCIVYKNYYTLKKTKVRHNSTITYKLEELK